MTDSMNQKTYEICSLQKQVSQSNMFREQLKEDNKQHTEKVSGQDFCIGLD